MGLVKDWFNILFQVYTVFLFYLSYLLVIQKSAPLCLHVAEGGNMHQKTHITEM